MDDYKEVTDTIEVPKNTGIDGFMHTVRTLLYKPRVQEIRIDARGTITCRRYAKQNDNQRNAGVDFEGLQPGSIVRNTVIEELPTYANVSAASVIGSLFDIVASEQLKPLAFMLGANSTLWAWYRHTSGVELRAKDTLHGLPVYADRYIPDTALIIVAGYGRDAALIDARKSYKIEMPQYNYPESDVEILL